MATAAVLRADKEHLIDMYFERTRVAEECRQRETAAAIRIQSVWRGVMVREELRRLHRTATLIQRMYRGHLGRDRADVARREYNRRMRTQYFNHAAGTIQRWYRGYHSRKFKHSFLARKAYIQSVLAKTDVLKSEMEAKYQAQVAEAEAAAEAARQAEEQEFMRKSHHLLSTATVPGVFSSPFEAMGGRTLVSGTMPGIEAEMRSLRVGGHTGYPLGPLSPPRSQKLPPPGTLEPLPSPHGSARMGAPLNSSIVPPSGAGSAKGSPRVVKATVRAAAPYGIVEETARIERVVDQRLQGNISQRAFVPTTGALPLKRAPSLSMSAPDLPEIVASPKAGASLGLSALDSPSRRALGATGMMGARGMLGSPTPLSPHSKPFLTTVKKVVLFEDV
eukprot:jgi/Mesvir1/29715/Mv00948-RA.1